MKKTIMLCLATIATAFALNSCEDVPAPYQTPSSVTDTSADVEASGSGTADDPYNVAAALELISAMDAGVNTDTLYVKGIITSISSVDPSYGNATYYIGDTENASSTLYVYRGKYLNNTNFTSEDQIAVGDTVVIKGLFVNYSGNTPETVTGKSWLVSINSTTATTDSDVEASGSGTADDPYNVTAALEVIGAMDADVNTDTLYVKGIITSISSVDTGYGNATYYIGDTKDASSTLYVYRGRYLDNTSFTSEDQIAVGDTVVIKGLFVNYYGNTPETVVNKNWLVSINGSTTGSSEGGTTSDGEASGSGTADDPYNVAGILSIKDSYDSSKDYYVKGIVSRVTQYRSSYGSLDYYLSDDGTTDNEFYVYSGLGLNGAKFTSTSDLTVGDTVVVKCNLTTYYDTFEANYNSVIVSMGSSSSDSGDTSGDITPGITVSGTTIILAADGVTASGSSITLDLSTFGFENAETVTTVTSDGCTITFSGGENTSNSPKYYTATNGVRMYANNVVTFTAEKTIATVTLNCDSYSGTDYVGNETRTFSCSNNVFTLTNTHTSSSGGVQMRIQTVTFTFAE